MNSITYSFSRTKYDTKNKIYTFSFLFFLLPQSTASNDNQVICGGIFGIVYIYAKSRKWCNKLLLRDFRWKFKHCFAVSTRSCIFQQHNILNGKFIQRQLSCRKNDAFLKKHFKETLYVYIKNITSVTYNIHELAKYRNDF